MTEEELEQIKRAAAAIDSPDPAEVDSAKRFFHQLSERDPTEAYYVLALGMAYDRKGELGQAELCFDRVLELSPTDHAAWVNRGHVKLRRGDTAGARADMMKALTLMPDDDREARLLVQATLAAMVPGGEQPH